MLKSILAAALAAIQIMVIASAASATPVLLRSDSMAKDVITVASQHIRHRHMTNHGHLG